MKRLVTDQSPKINLPKVETVGDIVTVANHLGVDLIVERERAAIDRREPIEKSMELGDPRLHARV